MQKREVEKKGVIKRERRKGGKKGGSKERERMKGER